MAIPASSPYPVCAVEGVQILQWLPEQLCWELAIELGQLVARFQVKLGPRLLFLVLLFLGLLFGFLCLLLSSNSFFNLHQRLWGESMEVGSCQRPKGEFHLLILLQEEFILL